MQYMNMNRICPYYWNRDAAAYMGNLAAYMWALAAYMGTAAALGCQIYQNIFFSPLIS